MCGRDDGGCGGECGRGVDATMVAVVESVVVMWMRRWWCRVGLWTQRWYRLLPQYGWWYTNMPVDVALMLFCEREEE